jgi:hypothetical protein
MTGHELHQHEASVYVNGGAPANVNNGWFEMVFPQSLATSYIGIGASPNDHTQFRIYFQSPLAAGHYEGWDSGESATSPPQLIVQHQ